MGFIELIGFIEFAGFMGLIIGFIGFRAGVHLQTAARCKARLWLLVVEPPALQGILPGPPLSNRLVVWDLRQPGTLFTCLVFSIRVVESCRAHSTVCKG